MILNLDENFKPTLEASIKFEMLRFGGGELHIKIDTGRIPSKEDVSMSNRIQNSDDIMEILIAKDALERAGHHVTTLITPYIPYARQDRYEIDGESFTLKVFANLLNSANFDKVIMLDAHSEVTPALINNSHNIKNHEYALEAIKNIVQLQSTHINTEIRQGNFALISPDSGANKKINGLYSYIERYTNNGTPFELPLIKCDKRRNMSDGTLGGFEVMTNDLEGRTCIIVDDICSRGGTFMGLAGALKEKNAGDIYLVVTHWENTADIEKLKAAGLKGVYKTNSMNDVENDFITNIPWLI